jgi:neutral ceramidase
VKRFGRIALRVALALAVLIFVTAVACLDTVNYEPYFRTSYYKQTKERLKSSASATNLIVRGTLEAGFGRAKLTPTLNAPNAIPAEGRFPTLPLAGYGNRAGKPATGVRDDLYVKAVAVRVAGRVGVMFGCDALIVPREVSDAASERLEKEIGLKREQLYFSATHTHCSFGGWGEGLVGEAFAGRFDPGARIWYAECIVRAAREAVADLRPAEFGRGSFEAREFIRNRLIGELGNFDPEFSFLIFKQAAGKVAILGSYSAHATTLGGDVMQFSADYPGYWQRGVEEATGGMAVFLAGGVGSHGPVSGGKSFEGSERMGGALAKKLIEKLPGIATTNQIAFGILGLNVTMPEMGVRVSDGMRLRPWVSRSLLPSLKESFLQGFRFADSIWLSTPCDYSGELAMGIKDHLAARGFDAVVTSFNGDYVGYVIPGRYYHLDGYEPRIMSFFGPYVPDYLDELARAVAGELRRN